MHSELNTPLPAPPPDPGEGRAKLQLGLEHSALWPCAQARSQAGEQWYQGPWEGPGEALEARRQESLQLKLGPADLFLFFFFLSFFLF